MPWSSINLQDVIHVDDDVDDDDDDDTTAEGDHAVDNEHLDDDDDDDEEEEEPGEFVCYGDRVCLLCDGQLLALTRKFNLSYQQMALLATATLLSGGLMGIASFFIWHKGLFRKKYAALLSELIYRESKVPRTHATDEHDHELQRKVEAMLLDHMSSADASHAADDHSTADAKPATTTTTKIPVETKDANHRLEKARAAVTFRFFEYDPDTQSIKYASLGQPVQFDAPLIVAHAASRRAIKYKPHHGAVTISRPPRNPHFRRARRDAVKEIEASLRSDPHDIDEDKNQSQQRKERKEAKPRPQSLTTALFDRVMHRHRPPPSADNAYDVVNLAPALAMLPARQSESALATVRRRSAHAHPAPARKSMIRSISESCITFVRHINDTVQVQKKRRALKKRRTLLLKDLPNMAFPGRDGQKFVARIRPPPSSNRKDQDQSLLRWGAPMQLIAAYNCSPCGFHSREYYRDTQQYMSTERTSCSPATMIPIPENGDLQAIAKESIRRLASMEKRPVTLKIGTYNVWMMPRKLSMFTSVSPKKNTRAKLIAEVLPPCDVWIFTECFDHRARRVLLDRLKTEGGYYFNSPTVGHKRKGPDGKYLDKLLNGGVVLASKYPILTVRIKLFREVSAGSDRFADKGVLYCKILKDGLLVHIFSTHLQAWNDEISRSARRRQLEIISEFMHSVGVDDKVDCVVVVGDLNVNLWTNPQNGEYDEMLDILNANDAAVRTTSQELGNAASQERQLTTKVEDFKRGWMYSFDGRLNPLAGNGLSSDGSLELLDYVLYSRAHRQPTKSASWVQPLFASTPWMWKKQPQFHLSDHFPVMSELTFEMWHE